MDEQRQAGGTGPVDAAAWRGNGALGVAGGAHAYGADQAWSSAGAALEPSAEPLTLLTAASHQPEQPPADHRRYAPGLDDDTPVGGMSTVEPPLWREAARHSPSLSQGYGAQLAEYPSAPAPEPPRAPPPPPPPAGPPAAPPPIDELSDSAGLPQRVPAEPDLPEVPGGEHGGREGWTAPELAWIADQLKRDDVPQAPAEGLDVEAVMEAVRGVPGVRSASVRPNPNGVHTLRLELADNADPGQVSRLVARLLEERMGLSAAPQEAPAAPPRTAPSPSPPPPPSPSPQPQPQPAAPPWDSAPPRDPAPPASREPVPPSSGQVSAPPWEPVPPSSGQVSAPPWEPVPPASGQVSAPPWAAPEPEPVRPLEPLPLPRNAPTSGPNPAAAAQPEPEPEPSQAAHPLRTDELGAAEDEPEVVSRPLHAPQPGPRVVIDQVRVNTFGLDAVVEVDLIAGDRRAHGRASGPAVDSYVVRLAAVSTANAIDVLLHDTAADEPAPGTSSSRCFVEHTGVMPFGSTEVAVVVLLLVCGGWVEQLTGSALVDGDLRQAMVRATLGAVNRRLEALLV